MTPLARTSCSAFSLVELLTVVALLSLLSVAAMPTVSQLGKTGRDSQNLVLVSGALEQAREYAISRNTYTWVAFQKLKSAPNQPVYMMAFASVDGSKAGVTTSGTYPVGGASSDLVVIDRLRKLENCALESLLPSNNALTSKLPPVTSQTFLAGEESGPTFQVAGSSIAGSDTDFPYSIMFTPAGEARVSAALPESVQLIVVPLKGGSVADGAAASVIRIYGLTGRVKVYHP